MIPIDISWALQDTLSKNLNFAKFSCDPANDFEQDLPYVLIQSTGGLTQNIVVDLYYVSFDVYAEQWAQATATATKVIGFLRSLVQEYIGNDEMGKVVVYDVDCDMLYDNPDPDLPTVPRVTFNVDIATRTKE